MDDRKGHTPRLPTWNYAAAWPYFVTFKVEGRRPLLGAVRNGVVELSPAGRIVRSCWQLLPTQFPVALEDLVIMPDHVHSILLIESGEIAAGRSDSGWQPLMSDSAPVLGKIVRAWKARATHEIRRSGEAEFRWQSRFYERVIRNTDELERIRAYIEDNPRRWGVARWG
jgi:putative transposase